MLKNALLCAAVLLTAACGQNSSPQYSSSSAQSLNSEVENPYGFQALVVGAPNFDRAPAQQALVTGSAIRSNNGPKLAYTHAVSVEMADDKIEPRFDRAQTSCLEDQSLSCNLIEATITVGDANAGIRPRGHLSVRLPHNSVASFQNQLLAPLPGERRGEPRLRRRSTTAEDLTFQIVDVDRRLTQASDFRDRLTAISRRGDAKVDDLIEVADKMSEVQSKIEELTVQNRTLNTRVDTELLNVDLNSYESLANFASPLGFAWRNSARELGGSAAGAFTFLIVALPWLPVVALGGTVLVWFGRLILKTRRADSIKS
jgi:hypothetical protein